MLDRLLILGPLLYELWLLNATLPMSEPEGQGFSRSRSAFMGARQRNVMQNILALVPVYRT